MSGAWPDRHCPLPGKHGPPTRERCVMDNDKIHDLVVRLARPGQQGGHVIERAAIMAAGADSAAVEEWILAHAGRPEQTQPTVATTGPRDVRP